MLLFIKRLLILDSSSASQLSKVLCFVSLFLFILWILILFLVTRAKKKVSINIQNSKKSKPITKKTVSPTPLSHCSVLVKINVFELNQYDLSP